MKKKNIYLGVFLIILVFVVIFYEYRIREYKAIYNTKSYHLKKGINLKKGDELFSKYFYEVMDDANKLPDDAIKSLADIDNNIALENLYEGDILRGKKIINKKNWCKDDERYVWIFSKSEEGVGGNDLKPTDLVDLYVYDLRKKSYVLDKDFENIQIIELKDKESVKYMDSSGKTFIIMQICFKLEKSKCEKLINNLKIAGNDFKITIHGNRPKIERVIEVNNPIVDTIGK